MKPSEQLGVIATHSSISTLKSYAINYSKREHINISTWQFTHLHKFLWRFFRKHQLCHILKYVSMCTWFAKRSCVARRAAAGKTTNNILTDTVHCAGMCHGSTFVYIWKQNTTTKCSCWTAEISFLIYPPEWFVRRRSVSGRSVRTPLIDS